MQLPSPIQWRAPFQVPELTHSVEINLNRHVSLPPHPRTSTLTLPGDTPSSGTTHGASRQASSVQSAWRLVSTAEPAASSSSGRRLAPMDNHVPIDSGSAGGRTSLEAARWPPLNLRKVRRIWRPISKVIPSAIHSSGRHPVSRPPIAETRRISNEPFRCKGF